jgi:hypothetical protein
MSFAIFLVSNNGGINIFKTLNKSKTITKPSLRNLFRTIAPFAFCYILANSSEEESSCLLDELLKGLLSYGCLSAVELLTIDENDHKLNELATTDLAFEGKSIYIYIYIFFYFKVFF